MGTNVNAHVQTDTLLDVKNLVVDYLASSGTVHAVTDVNFTLKRGEILGLAGESGSGKSTLAYAITCLLRPPAIISGGEILYFPRTSQDGRDNSRVTITRLSKTGKSKHAKGEGEQSIEETKPIDLLQLSPAQLRDLRWNDLAIVFQSAMNALNPVMTVGSQIMDVLRTHRPDMGSDTRKKRAQELFQLVGIAPDRLRSYPHELSGGMRQRAIIAIALALSPEILIMDEPTTALDVVVQREILTEIIRLREKLGFAVIFITHDLSLLLELADHVAIMYAGRIVEKASRRDLYLHPRHPYSYGLLNSFPSLHGPRRKMAGIPGSPPDLRSVPPGCAFHLRCPLAIEVCHEVLPSLLAMKGEKSEQLVACHLYDPVYNMEPPTTLDLARKYEALAEESNAG
ncbi:MAG TPA: ABC transporter ATP-binding protein [Ktedonobacteraceae bacterium]|jgi:peptide/nickel transport system ATP-binding protein|nr:ABC transporter ATP-binding protein [Ktedonobacteraceae bacterium]